MYTKHKWESEYPYIYCTALKAIHKNGGNAHLHICYGMGHNAWDVAYEGDELVNWMLQHTRNNKNNS